MQHALLQLAMTFSWTAIGIEQRTEPASIGLVPHHISEFQGRKRITSAEGFDARSYFLRFIQIGAADADHGLRYGVASKGHRVKKMKMTRNNHRDIVGHGVCWSAGRSRRKC